MEMELNSEEEDFILEAKSFLEDEGMLLRLTSAMGRPVEAMIQSLPDNWEKKFSVRIEQALYKAYELALHTVGSTSAPSIDQNRYLHNGLSLVSGTIGGFFGPASLFVELPITTTLIMRNIIKMAQAHKLDMNDPKVSFQCLYIFGLGSSKTYVDNTMDTAYYTSRIGLSKLFQEASEFVATHSSKTILNELNKGSAPALIRFISRVASQFQIVMTDKFLAKSIPIIGAVSGGAINMAFMNYYGKVAHYHFGLLKLEEKHGKEVIQEAYLRA